MKRNLDKTWLKVTALLLFIVFAAYAATGIMGTVPARTLPLRYRCRRAFCPVPTNTASACGSWM